MKLLFDENLSPRLPQILASQFPGSVHVRDCGLRGLPDAEIWEYARINGFAIISKDSDFYYRCLLATSSPKLIWLRVGNCRREEIVTLMPRTYRTSETSKMMRPQRFWSYTDPRECL